MNSNFSNILALLIFYVFFTLNLLGQEDSSFSKLDHPRNWSVDLTIGSSIGHHPVHYDSLHVIPLNSFHTRANIRYMFNNKFGIMYGLGYDKFDFGNVGTTHYSRSDIELVFNLGRIMEFESFTKKIGLQAHTGFGISHMWGGNLPHQKSKNSIFRNADDMLNITFGLKLMYKLSHRVALYSDASFIFHGRQTHHFDLISDNKYTTGFNGYFTNWGIGVSIYLGKKKNNQDAIREHYDWYVNKKCCNKTEKIYYQELISSNDSSYNEISNNKSKNVSIWYNLNKYEIDKAYYNDLNSVIEKLLANPSYKLKIIGHTDDLGSVIYNNELSKKRAEEVKNYFILNNINESRIIISSEGKEQLKYSGKSKLENNLNRRVELVIIPQ